MCHLLNNNPVHSVFYFKSVIQENKAESIFVKTPSPKHDAIAGLMMAYCQLQREREALLLIDEKSV